MVDVIPHFTGRACLCGSSDVLRNYNIEVEKAAYSGDRCHVAANTRAKAELGNPSQFSGELDRLPSQVRDQRS
jgi:hypothetical protein